MTLTRTPRCGTPPALRLLGSSRRWLQATVILPACCGFSHLNTTMKGIQKQQRKVRVQDHPAVKAVMQDPRLLSAVLMQAADPGRLPRDAKFEEKVLSSMAEHLQFAFTVRAPPAQPSMDHVWSDGMAVDMDLQMMARLEGLHPSLAKMCARDLQLRMFTVRPLGGWKGWTLNGLPDGPGMLVVGQKQTGEGGFEPHEITVSWDWFS